MRSQLLPRIALIVVALLLVAWLALGLRATRLEAQGRDLLKQAEDGPLERAEVRDGLRALRRARRFNADSDVLLTEARLLALQGRGQEAIDLGRRIVSDEPNNLDGWVLLYLSSAFTADEEAAQLALRRVDELNPQLADRLRAREPLEK